MRRFSTPPGAKNRSLIKREAFSSATGRTPAQTGKASREAAKDAKFGVIAAFLFLSWLRVDSQSLDGDTDFIRTARQRRLPCPGLLARGGSQSCTERFRSGSI